MLIAYSSVHRTTLLRQSETQTENEFLHQCIDVWEIESTDEWEHIIMFRGVQIPTELKIIHQKFEFYLPDQQTV